MATGFIYVVTSVGRDYEQPTFRSVPTVFEGSLYFGPCKRRMRPRMQEGDFVFGISSSTTFPRRVVFATQISERLTFGQAYAGYPKLRGPNGPIHVRPARMNCGESFPDSDYEHIPGAMHPEDWRSDIRTPDHDAFFVCQGGRSALGPWLGATGPAIKGEILAFLQSCAVYGAGLLSASNLSATETNPVSYRRLNTGLHLETPKPCEFLKLVLRSTTHRTPTKEAPLEQKGASTFEKLRSPRRRVC
jgi:hypothetical protein